MTKTKRLSTSALLDKALTIARERLRVDPPSDEDCLVISQHPAEVKAYVLRECAAGRVPNVEAAAQVAREAQSQQVH